ncbi:hypothetical protein AB0K16_25400 [Nonomuraea jabiensis]|uniref:hypothetical protein n=1 Tax=Nonomuraea jabiensis TaxID=882448 RepID=UPI0034428E0B
MSRVFLGCSRDVHRVAVKVVRLELADDARFRRRFAAEVAARVVGADPGGRPAVGGAQHAGAPGGIVDDGRDVPALPVQGDGLGKIAGQ